MWLQLAEMIAGAILGYIVSELGEQWEVTLEQTFGIKIPSSGQGDISEIKNQVTELTNQANGFQTQVINTGKQVTTALANELDAHDKTVAFNKTQQGQIRALTDAELTRHEKNATFNEKQEAQIKKNMDAELTRHEENATFNEKQEAQIKKNMDAELTRHEKNATFNEKQLDAMGDLMEAKLYLHEQTETFNDQESKQISGLVQQQLDAHQKIMDAKAEEKAAAEAVRAEEKRIQAEKDAKAKKEAEDLKKTEQEWSDTIQGLIKGTTTWEDIWQKACDRTLDRFIDMVVQIIMQNSTLLQDLGKVLGIGNSEGSINIGDSSGNFFGDLWNGITGFFGDIFGGIGSIFGFQHGGMVPLLAARGMVVPDINKFGSDRVLSALTPKEMVLPVHLSEGLQNMIANGGGGPTYVTNNYISAIDTQSFQQALAKPENRAVIRGHNAASMKQTGRAW